MTQANNRQGQGGGEVRREGPAMGATPAPESAEAVRYTPTAGGADAWRWGGDGQ